MDDLKLYAQNMEQLETLVNTVQIFGQDIGMAFGISIKVWHFSNKERKT